MVFGVQIPIRLTPEEAAKRADLSKGPSKHLSLAGFMQSLFQLEMDSVHGFALQILYTTNAIWYPGILDADPQLNIDLFFCNFLDSNSFHGWDFTSPKWG